MSLKTFTDAMATSTTAYCAVIDGVLNPMTLHMDRKQSARAAYSIKVGYLTISTCTDPDCDCMVKLLTQNYPDVKIVPVDVTVRE